MSDLGSRVIGVAPGLVGQWRWHCASGRSQGSLNERSIPSPRSARWTRRLLARLLNGLKAPLPSEGQLRIYALASVT